MATTEKFDFTRYDSEHVSYDPDVIRFTLGEMTVPELFGPPPDDYQGEEFAELPPPQNPPELDGVGMTLPHYVRLDVGTEPLERVLQAA